jgi:hypothetical protein
MQVKITNYINTLTLTIFIYQLIKKPGTIIVSGTECVSILMATTVANAQYRMTVWAHVDCCCFSKT